MFGAPTNADRAEWAQTAVDAFMAVTETDEEDAIPDLITNLLHLQRRKLAAHGLPFDAAEFVGHRATMHDMEVEEDPEDEYDDSHDSEGDDE